MPGQDDETIIVRAILRDELSDPADRINQSLSDMGDSMDDAGRRADDLTEAERRNAEQSQKTARQIQAENQARNEQGQFIRNATDEVNRNTQAQRTNTRESGKNTKALDKSKKSIMGVLSKFAMFSKAGAMLDAVSMAATGIGALGTAAIAAGAGVGAMSGALLPVPALLAGLGQAAIVGKMAFSGMGDAIGALASGDYTKFGEATKDMAPNMVAAAKSMGEFGQQLKPIVKDVQNTVWDGFSKEMDTLGKSILPDVQKSLIGTAKGLNLSVVGFMKFLNSAQGVGMLETVLDGTSAISFELGASLQDVGKAALGMFSAVMPVARKMSVDIADGIGGLSDAILNNQDKITAFADRGYAIFKRFIGVIVDLAKGIYNIGKLSMNMAGFMGKGIEDAARKFKDWTASVEGQKKIAAYFESMKPILQALAGLGKAVGQAFFQIGNTPGLAGVINQFTDLVPVFVELVNQASGHFIPALLEIAGSLAKVVVDSGALHVTAFVLNAAATAANALAAAFGALPGPVQTAIGTMVGLGLVVRSLAFSSFTPLLVKIPLVGKAITLLRTQILLFGNGLKMMFAAGGIKGALQFLLMSFRALRVAVIGALTPIWTFLVSNPIGWIILAVAALIGIFILLWKKCEGFRNLVKSIGQWFVDVWNNQIKPAIMATWNWIKDVWTRIWAFIRPIVMTIVNFIVSYFKWACNNLKTIAEWLWPKIVAGWNIIKNTVMAVVNVVVAIWRWGMSIIGPIVASMINWIKQKWEEIKPTVMALWQAIKNTFEKIRDAVMPIISTIVNFIKDNFSKLKYLLLPLLLPIIVIFGIIAAVVIVVVAIIVGVFVAAFLFVKYVVWPILQGIISIIMGIWNIIIRVATFIIQAWGTAFGIVRGIVGAVIGAIGSIIGSIIGIVSSVVGAVVGFFSGAFNAISGIVSGVIGGVRGIIGGLGSFVGSVVGGIRNAFSTAFNAVRNVVMPIINAIKDAIQGVLDMAGRIGNAISSAASAINPFNFAGGPITAGATSWVGELGPEAFVTHTGKVEMIGQHGMELMDFNRPGYIVPNHVLRGYSDPSVPGNVMSKLSGAMQAPAPTMGNYQSASARENLSSDTYMQEKQGGGNHYDFRGAHFGGDPATTKKAVKDALNEIERNKKERG